MDARQADNLQHVLTSLLDGRLLAERHGGSVPDVIALHGWGRTRADWATTLAGCDAVAIDLPGFGATPPPEQAWSTEQYAQQLIELLDDAHPQVLLGHSFGGRVAVQMARLRPTAVSALVLTGVPLLRAELPGGRSKAPLQFRVGKWLHQRGLVTAPRMEKLRNKFGSEDYRQAQGVLRGILVQAVNEDYTQCLQAIAAANIGLELVWGAHDPAAPVSVAEKAAALVGSQANLDVVAGSAHLLDDGLVQHLRAALNRVGVATGEG